MKPTLSVEVSAALAGLQKRWPELTSDVDKASAVYTVYCLKVSTRVLAENLGCSATLIRNLLRVAKAPAADKFLARKGKNRHQGIAPAIESCCGADRGQRISKFWTRNERN